MHEYLKISNSHSILKNLSNEYYENKIKMLLSVTGFEPAISRFVAERVIRCATRMGCQMNQWC